MYCTTKKNLKTRGDPSPQGYFNPFLPEVRASPDFSTPRPSGPIGWVLCGAPERFGARNGLPTSLGFLGGCQLMVVVGWVGVVWGWKKPALSETETIFLCKRTLQILELGWSWLKFFELRGDLLVLQWMYRWSWRVWELVDWELGLV